MPAPVTNGQQTMQLASPPGRGGDTPQILVPFVRAARRQRIPTELDRAIQLTGSSVQVESFEVPAQGWLRGIWLLVEASGGTGVGAVAAADGPWSVISSVQITDPAGNPIYGPLAGYSAYLSNYFGGYQFVGRPEDDPAFSAVSGTGGNFSFLLYLPIEASGRDAYGALPNQDSSAAYRVNISQAPSTQVYATPPATLLPVVRWRAWVDVWSQPTPVDLAGNPQQQSPPGAGTTQFWTTEVQTTVGSFNTLRVRRVGNLFRTIIVVLRDAAGARLVNTALPDPTRWTWDSLVLTDQSRVLQASDIARIFGYTAAELPAGVQAFTFTDDLDGHAGYELRNALLPTTKATRLEYSGTIGTAGSATFLLNDVQPVNLP